MNCSGSAASLIACLTSVEAASTEENSDIGGAGNHYNFRVAHAEKLLYITPHVIGFADDLGGCMREGFVHKSSPNALRDRKILWVIPFLQIVQRKHERPSRGKQPRRIDGRDDFIDLGEQAPLTAQQVDAHKLDDGSSGGRKMAHWKTEGIIRMIFGVRKYRVAIFPYLTQSIYHGKRVLKCAAKRWTRHCDNADVAHDALDPGYFKESPMTNEAIGIAAW